MDYDLGHAEAIAREFYGIRASASTLSSERDQNFLLTTSDRKFVLKIANASEKRAFLEAQDAVLKHLAEHVSFCQSVVPASSGEEIINCQDNFARLMNYVPGVPLAEARPHSPELLRDLGQKLGQLAHALADFDHPAVHRDFYWDLANGNRIIDEFAPLIENRDLRQVVFKCRMEHQLDLRRSVIHGDANDYNVLVDPQRNVVTGLLDFGDMVYSYTVGDLVIAIAYVVLDKTDPRAVAEEVINGYRSEFELVENELKALWKLVRLRLGMSVCIAAYQTKQRPENEYLGISQKAIEEFFARDLRG
ncbi:MAG TPA: phosphotransferase [Pyrinomonadaceae bacterium]|nr:phosphotransferase [Pyrinomonadaceae bacterium]